MLAQGWTEEELSDPKKWGQLPKEYRLVELGDDLDWMATLIGFKIHHYMVELGRWIELSLGVAEAIQYAFYHPHNHIEAVYMRPESGEEVTKLCRTFVNKETLAVAIWSESPAFIIARQCGSLSRNFDNQLEQPDFMKGRWYESHARFLYRLDGEGKRLPKYHEYDTYSMTLEIWRNRYAHKQVQRSIPNQVLAQQYQLEKGCEVVLVVKPTGHVSSHYELTVGNTYTLLDFEGSNVIITTDDNSTASINWTRVIRVVPTPPLDTAKNVVT